MNRLARRLAALIRADGPLGIADYMRVCLFDPTDGYYTTRDPFGVDGDFTTAPEISQMFGELVGVWLGLAWEAVGRPLPVTVAEIGPGRGTLMRDVLRTLRRLSPDLAARGTFAMVEASPRLTQVQRATLAGTDATLTWHESVAALPRQPLFVVGNELFDAIPVRQFLSTGDGWRERVVGLDDDEQLVFGAAGGPGDAAFVPEAFARAPVGSIYEVAPEREALMAELAGRIAGEGGAGLFIDYGHFTPAPGDTLQAVRRHAPHDVLTDPGTADLTTHVDFSALVRVAETAGVRAYGLTQGAFLLRLGLLERAGALGANRDDAGREELMAAVERLAGPSQMGDHFKVMAVLPQGVAVAPFDLDPVARM